MKNLYLVSTEETSDHSLPTVFLLPATESNFTPTVINKDILKEAKYSN